MDYTELQLRADRQPGVSEDLAHSIVVTQRVRDNLGTPSVGARRTRCSSRCVPTAWPRQASATTNATSGGIGARQTVVASNRDDVVAIERHERFTVVVVDVRESCDLALAQVRMQHEESQPGGLVSQPFVEVLASTRRRS